MTRSPELAALLSCVGIAGCTGVGMDTEMDDPQARVAQYLNDSLEDGAFPGAVYWVATRDRDLLHWQGGVLDVAEPEPVGPQTVFMLNSSTKIFTAVAILQLAEAGKLSLDASVSDHFPGNPYGDELTIRHLLNYSGGVPNPAPLKWLHSPSQHAGYDESAALAAALAKYGDLDFAPGAKYQYSNLAFWILGAIIEEASEQSIEDYFAEHIRSPLGIEPADLSFEIRAPKRLATGHQRRWRPLTAILYLLTDRTIWAEPLDGWSRFAPVYHNGRAYGGLYATGGALHAFLQDLVAESPKTLSPAWRDQLITPQKSTGGELLGTGLGWAHGRLDGVQWFGKPGGGPGFHSNIRIYPDKGMVSVLLVNRTEVSESPINEFTDRLDAQFLATE